MSAFPRRTLKEIQSDSSRRMLQRTSSSASGREVQGCIVASKTIEVAPSESNERRSSIADSGFSVSTGSNSGSRRGSFVTPIATPLRVDSRRGSVSSRVDSRRGSFSSSPAPAARSNSLRQTGSQIALEARSAALRQGSTFSRSQTFTRKGTNTSISSNGTPLQTVDERAVYQDATSYPQLHGTKDPDPYRPYNPYEASPLDFEHCDMAQKAALNKALDGFPESCELFTVLWLRGFIPQNQGGGSFCGPQFSWNTSVLDSQAFHSALMKGGHANDKVRNEMLGRINRTLRMLAPPYLRSLLIHGLAFICLIVSLILLIMYFVADPDADGHQPVGLQVVGLIILGLTIFLVFLGLFIPHRYVQRNRKRDKTVEVNLQQVNTFFDLRKDTFIYRSLEEDLGDRHGLKFLNFFGMKARCRCVIILHPPAKLEGKFKLPRVCTNQWADVILPKRQASPPPNSENHEIDASMNQNIHSEGIQRLMGMTGGAGGGPNYENSSSDADSSPAYGRI